MNYEYRPYVFKNNIEIIEDKGKLYRYLLRIPFSKQPQNRALIILKNPSIATGKSSDYTVNKVCDYCYQKGFDEVLILNLFSFRAKDASNMVQAAEEYGDDYVIGEDNDKYIKSAIGSVNKIIIAWGENPSNYKKQYDKRIENVLRLLKGNNLYYVGKVSKKGNYPLHG